MKRPCQTITFIHGATPMTRRILVVDDYRDAAEFFAVLLKHLGHDVRTASDGFQAIAVAEEFRPEVILLDLGLPDLNGFETAKRIRKESWSERTVLIAISGYGNKRDRQLSQEAGFDAHLLKPASVKDIVDLIEKFSYADPAC
jgi:CheY-like chemotaxis protein